MKLIGIVGHAGSGKDTVAQMLHNDANFEVFHFADILKAGVAMMFSLKEEQLWGSKKEEIDPYWRTSPRKILQFVGTDLFREQISKLIPWLGTDIWVKATEKLMEEEGYFDITKKEKKVVIADVRFQNEVQWILSKGGSFIHVVRPGYNGMVGLDGHPSEDIAGILSCVDDDGKWAIFNDSTIERLQREVTTYIDEHNL